MVTKLLFGRISMKKDGLKKNIFWEKFIKIQLIQNTLKQLNEENFNKVQGIVFKKIKNKDKRGYLLELYKKI